MRHARSLWLTRPALSLMIWVGHESRGFGAAGGMGKSLLLHELSGSIFFVWLCEMFFILLHDFLRLVMFSETKFVYNRFLLLILVYYTDELVHWVVIDYNVFDPFSILFTTVFFLLDNKISSVIHSFTGLASFWCYVKAYQRRIFI